MLSNQEIFDRVSSHLLTQGKPALRDGECVYRTPEGLRCAIGCLIPDALYAVELEGIAVRQTRDVEALPHYTHKEDAFRLAMVLLASGIDLRQEKTFSLCAGLQYVHDNRGPELWRECLQYLAQVHGLSADVLKG